MLIRAAIVLGALVFSTPLAAEELRPQEAERFVVGRLFDFTCFEGTRGVGRIHADGSVAGSIQFSGQGKVHYVRLPAGTLRVADHSVCAYLKGLPFQPCFNVDKTSTRSFRGSVSGFGFAYCDFTRRTANASVGEPQSLTAVAGRD